MHVFFGIGVSGFFGYIPSSRIAGSKTIPSSNFWRNSIMFSTVAAPVCIPTNSALGFPFPTSSPTLVVCWFINDSHTDRCEMKSHCSFNFHLSDGYWCWAFLYVYGPSVCPPWRSVYWGSLPIFNWIVFLLLSHISFLYILEIKSLSDVSLANMFSHTVSSFFILMLVSLVMQLFNLMYSHLFILFHLFPLL